MVKTGISILLFAISGFLSMYLYNAYFNDGAFLLPGFLFTSTSLLVFLLYGRTADKKNLLIYYSLMILTYLAVWFITLISSWFGFIVGVISAGMGALLTFRWTNRYIVPLPFKNAIVFSIGAFSFLLTDILAFSLERMPVTYLFKKEPTGIDLFSEVFFFWHLLVGGTLSIMLGKIQRQAGVGRRWVDRDRQAITSVSADPDQYTEEYGDDNNNDE